MKVEIFPSGKVEALRQNIEKRCTGIKETDGKLVAEVNDAGFLRRTPGIEKFRHSGELHEGMGGKPVEEQAYARLESKRDAVRAFLATLEGYSLVVLDTERQWDLKQLRKFNPDIKELKSQEPEKGLGIEKTLFPHEEFENVEIDLGDRDIEETYREKLT